MKEFFDKIQGLISQRFLLAYFLPMAVILAANILLVQEVFPEAKAIDTFINPDGGWKPWPSFVFIVAATAIAYILSPLNNYIREVLEGKRLPTLLRKNGVSGQEGRSRKLDNDVTRAREIVNTLKTRKKRYEREEAAAAEKSQEKTPKRETLEKVSAELAALSVVDFERFDANCEMLDIINDLFVSAFQQYHPFEKNEKIQLSFDDLQGRFQTHMKYLIQRARGQLHSAQYEYAISFGRTRIAPTSFGNHIESLRQYCQDRYRIDFDSFWEHLAGLKRDATEGAVTNDFSSADEQIEFLINMLLFSIFFLIWPVIIYLNSDNMALFFIMALTPLLGMFVYYQSLKQAYRTWVVSRRAAIDIYRCEVMDHFKLGNPSTLSREKEIWKQFYNHIASGEPATVYYYNTEK